MKKSISLRIIFCMLAMIGNVCLGALYDTKKKPFEIKQIREEILRYELVRSEEEDEGIKIYDLEKASEGYLVDTNHSAAIIASLKNFKEYCFGNFLCMRINNFLMVGEKALSD